MTAVPYANATNLVAYLNAGPPIFANNVHESAHARRLSTSSLDNGDLGARDLPLAALRTSDQITLNEFQTIQPPLLPGYVTTDDFGTDGDDTLHKPVNFYVVPNCVQAEVGFPQEGEPEAVDLVFLDFITPWILMALRVVGGEYSEKDVQLYAEGTFTDMMAGWIEENWPKHC